MVHSTGTAVCHADEEHVVLTECTQLVKQFYQPGNPAVIAAIDDQLKKLQHSPEGWQLADALLASQDANVRFFAALTFQVKLNNDGSVLRP